MPPAPPAWQGQQGMGQPTATHPQGPQGLSIPPAPPVWQGMQASGLPIAAHTQGLPGQYGLPAAPGPIGVGAPAPLATPTPLAPGNQQGTQQGGAPLAPQAPGTQQGGAQIAVQPPGGGGAGPARTPTGIGANAPSSQESSGIAGALDRLAPYMTDADTSRSLRWQQNVNGDAAKIAAWKLEATALPGLQFFAYMQPGEAFLVVGHTLSTIYSTTTDIASYHGKVVLFTGDRTATRECVPVVLPPQSAFAWKKCRVIDDRSKLAEWYADNPAEYGNLWDPTGQDGTRTELLVPRMLALPLWAAKLYHNFNGAVMPHELLAAIEQHLASPVTALDNGDDWGLVQRWLMVAAQRDDGGGDPTKRQAHIAFATGSLLSNDALIHRWTNDRLDATLGRRIDPNRLGTTVGIQGNMAIVQNMSGIIATEVGKGLGVAMQNATKASTAAQAGTSGAHDDTKPYTQDQVATLLGFHGAMNVSYLTKVWRLFKISKAPNYDHLRRAIKSEMLRWADSQRCWIEEGVYFDNKTLDEWISLKFNPGDSTALYSSADKGISILKCRAPTSAHLEDLRRQEEIWDATKGNATYVEVVKQAKSKDVCHPPHEFGELRSNISTYCALLFTLFGEGCDLYRSMLQVLQVLSHPFCMQNKQAYTPEVVRRIIWAIIVDTRSFFDDIKLAEDFIDQGHYMQFPASTLEGDLMSIKHGIKLQRHNFPHEWAAPDVQPGPQYYQGKVGGIGGYHIPPGVPSGPPSPWPKHPPLAPQNLPPYNWRPAGFVDDRHPKISAMMEPLLMKFRGRISVSNILTAGGKRFDNLPRLAAYPSGVCWLHAIATCPYGDQCSFSSGHIAKGALSDAEADEAVAALLPGVSALVARNGPPSPTGKRKFRAGRGRGGGGAGAEPPATPQA